MGVFEASLNDLQRAAIGQQACFSSALEDLEGRLVMAFDDSLRLSRELTSVQQVADAVIRDKALVIDKVGGHRGWIQYTGVR